MKQLLLLLVLGILWGGRLFAQEVQVPFDSAGKLEIITEDIENHLQLFTGYPHFHEGRLFKLSDSSYILEISSLSDDGKLSRNREPKTKQDVLAFQKQVAEVVTERSSSVLLDQSSRSKFLVWETLLGVFAYGPLFSASLNSTNNIGVTSGLELVVGGLGFVVPYVLTKNAPMTDGEASFALGGAFNGAIHGVLIDLLVTNGNSGNEAFALTALGSIAETGIGYAVARTYNFSEGKSDIIRYGGFFGTGEGTLLALLINTDNPSPALVSGLSLLGSAGGYYAGMLLSNNESYTRGNASTVLTAGLYGPAVSLLIYGSLISENAFNNNNPGSVLRGFALSSMIGNIGGVLLAHELLRGKRFSTGEGNDVILGTSAGFIIGWGFSLILTSSATSNTSLWAFSLPIILGTAGGFGIMLSVIGKGSGDDRSTG
ncbi:MAG: hypothetical protein ACHQM6_07375, partial [Candidatus Kapaibacterium sp.]